MREVKRVVLALLAAMVAACATTQPVRKAAIFRVEVSGLASESRAATARTYVLLPGVAGVEANDLQFQEFARYVRGAMGQRGYVATDVESADMVVFLAYAISDRPEVLTVTRTVPVYGVIGGGTATVSSWTTSLDGGLPTHTASTVQLPASTVQVGQQAYTEQHEVYHRSVELDAWDLRAFRELKAEVPVWRMRIASSGSSGDLRHVFPALVVAAEAHIGTDTGRRLRVEIRGDDPRIAALRATK